MRPKFIIALGLLTFLILGASLFLKRQLGNTSAPSAAVETVPLVPPAVSNIVVNAAQPSAPAPALTAGPAITNVVLSAEEREAAIDAETDRLQEWSMNDDPASLSNILADLTSPEKEVREAAIEATKQFGSTNAIPALKAAANSTDDTQEKIDLLEAANFLSLPSMTFGRSGTGTPKTPEQIQAAAQRKAEREARRQAQLQKRAPNQNSPAAPNQ